MVKLTKEELETISNLLFTGKWGFSFQENVKIVQPIINKIAKIISEDKKPNKK